jgi:hypothetical protein
MLYRNVIYAPNNTLAGWRAWRLRVTEPGVWMVHCHILLHMVFGMQTVSFLSCLLQLNGPCKKALIYYRSLSWEIRLRCSGRCLDPTWKDISHMVGASTVMRVIIPRWWTSFLSGPRISEVLIGR